MLAILHRVNVIILHNLFGVKIRFIFDLFDQAYSIDCPSDEGGYSCGPSVQSQDHTFNMGSSSATQEAPQLSMLFTAP